MKERAPQGACFCDTFDGGLTTRCLRALQQKGGCILWVWVLYEGRTEHVLAVGVGHQEFKKGVIRKHECQN